MDWAGGGQVGLMAWKHQEQLNPGVNRSARRRLVVGVEGVEAGGTPALRVFFVLEEDQARLLGVDLEVFPEEPVAVKFNLEII